MPERTRQPEWKERAERDAREALREFITSPGLESVVTIFDPEFADIRDESERFRRLIKVARSNWNYRQGKERQQMETQAHLDDPASDVSQRVFAGTRELHMVDPSRATGHFDVLAEPGGANTSPLKRVEWAAEQDVTVGMEVYLGSERPVKGAEVKNVAGYAPDAKSEFDLGVAALKTVHGDHVVDDDTHVEGVGQGGRGSGKKWRVVHIEADDGVPRFAISAPPNSAPPYDGRDRANTADTYAFMRRMATDELGPGKRMLVSTNAFFVPFQYFDALREITLTTGTEVVAIGFDAAYDDKTRTASQLLQELLSAVDAAQKLRVALGDSTIEDEQFETEPAAETYEVKDWKAVGRRVPGMRTLRRRKAGYNNEPIDHDDERHNEAMRPLSAFGLAGQAYYSHANAATGEPIAEVPRTILLRESDGRTLQAINAALADERFTKLFGGEVELFIEDGFRDPALQRLLHDEVFPRPIREQHRGITDEEVAQRVKEMIAIPSTNPDKPSPHLTGAFDVSLRYKQVDRGYVPGVQVPMGHYDGETSQRVYPDHFERRKILRVLGVGLFESAATKQARANRRAFAAVMSGAVFNETTDFAVNPTEWWHYSRGDQLWARVNRVKGRVVQAFRGIATKPE